MEHIEVRVLDGHRGEFTEEPTTREEEQLMAKYTTRKNSHEAKAETRRRREVRKAKQFCVITIPALAS